MKKIVIYAGRFQPFGKHHAAAYKWVNEKFGEAFIATSDSINEYDSPFNFAEKRELIKASGVPRSQIICCKQPYRPVEILEKFTGEECSLVLCIGSKDMNRFKPTKKDGTQSYFQPYVEGENLRSVEKCGYIVEIPDQYFETLGGEPMSGSTLRGSLPNCSPEQFEEMMGWYDENLAEMVRVKCAMFEASERITKTQLQRIEQYVDKLFKVYNIDIEFQDIYRDTHFYQRLNDPRNGTPITSDELRSLFVKISRKYGERLSKLNSGAEGVLKDMESDINLPFLIKHDKVRGEIDLIPKTIMRKKNFKTNTPEYTVELNEGVEYRFNKNIEHPFQDRGKSISELVKLLSLIASEPQRCDIYMKMDGQNVKVTKINGVYLIAKNKADLNAPLDAAVVSDRYKDKPYIEMNYLSLLSDAPALFDELGVDFKNGRVFINCEILNPDVKNLYLYYKFPVISIHNLLEVTEAGVIANDIPNKMHAAKGKIFKAEVTKNVFIIPEPVAFKTFEYKLNTLLSRKGLRADSPIQRLYDIGCGNDLEIMVHQFSNSIIRSYIRRNKINFADENLNFIMDMFDDVSNRIKGAVDEKMRSTYDRNLENLIKVGGLKTVNPIEGFVFVTPDGAQYKLTGSFSYINQILGIFKYHKS